MWQCHRIGLANGGCWSNLYRDAQQCQRAKCVGDAHAHVLVVLSFLLFEITESIGLAQVHLRISQKGMSLV